MRENVTAEALKNALRDKSHASFDAINHLDVRTGRLGRVMRGEVQGDVVARLAPWLAAAIELDEFVPLPYAARQGFSAAVGAAGGALCVAIREPGMHFCVAKTEHEASQLWKYVACGLPGAPAAGGIEPPPLPWCATMGWPRLAEQPQETLDWLTEFARSVAWVWVNHVSFKLPTRDRDRGVASRRTA